MKRFLAALLLALAACSPSSDTMQGAPEETPTPAQPIPVPGPSASEVSITGVQPSHSAAKVYFTPVPGAKDYRIYDVATPTDVKYAGLTHLVADSGCTGNAAVDKLGPDANGNARTSCFRHFLTNPDGSLKFPYERSPLSYPSGAQGGPTAIDSAALEVDYNGLGDGKPHTLVVEAVDALGPVPYMNLYKEVGLTDLVPLFPGEHAGHMVMMGGNKGPTQDGKTSTNGQGPFSNQPRVIAASHPFVVQADRSHTPIIAGASQVFLDTFEDAEPLVAVPGDCEHFTTPQGDVGGRQWTLNAGTGRAWEIIARQVNCRDTMPFIMSNHFMDVLSDGLTAGTGGGPINTIYGSLSMTPVQTFRLNGGILHLTQEVDDVLFGDRWMDFNIAPASDPLTHWNHQDAALNQANQWLYLINFGENGQLLVSDGPTGDLQVHGDWAEAWSFDLRRTYDERTFTANGLGFDNKRRWDFFLSATWAALFIEGRLVQQGPIPADKAAWLSGPLKVYFTHYNYHSEAGWKAMLTTRITNSGGYCYPLLSFWYNDPVEGITPGAPVTYVGPDGLRHPANGYGNNNCARAYPPGYGYRGTDERHWDNMGASVLPASIAAADDFSSLAVLVQPPRIR